MDGEPLTALARMEFLEAHSQVSRSLIRSYLRGELGHSAFAMRMGLLWLDYDLQLAGGPDSVTRLYNPNCDCPVCTAVREMGLRSGHAVPYGHVVAEGAGCEECESDDCPCDCTGPRKHQE